MGFQNGNYWSSAVARTPGSDEHIPHSTLLQEVNRIANRADFTNCQSVHDWCDRHQISDQGTVLFESRGVHELCATVIRQQQQQSTDYNEEREALTAFAEQVVETEMRILLLSALTKAGFSVADLSEPMEQPTLIPRDPPISQQTVDEYEAISASRKVSSAHLAGFRDHGSITIRRVASISEVSSSAENVAHAFSVAAGVASRLLESAGVEECENAEQGSIQILLRSATDGHVDIGDTTYLGPGDLYACTNPQIHPLSCQSGVECFFFKSALKDNPEAVFVDPLHGSRGETPTTVIQWSKGTAF